MNSSRFSDYAQVLQELERLADPAYKAFTQKLTPGVQVSYGVRLPQLRSLAKEILRGDGLEFLQGSAPRSYEETMLRGMVLGGLKLSWEEKRPWVEEFLPLIDNWAVCDSFCTSFRLTTSDREAVWAFLRPLYTDSREYAARFAGVMQLTHFVDQNHLEEGLALLIQLRHPGYYARMAAAWALSEWFIVFPGPTENLFAQKVLDPWVQNKAIQKVRESRRVTQTQKDALLTYKR